MIRIQVLPVQVTPTHGDSVTVQVSCPIRRRATTPPLWSPMLSCLVPRFGSEDTKMPSQSPPTFSLQQCKSSDLSCASSKVFLAIRFRLQLPQCAKKSFHRTKNLFICDSPPLTFCLRGEGGLPLISSYSSSSLTHSLAIHGNQRGGGLTFGLFEGSLSRVSLFCRFVRLAISVAPFPPPVTLYRGNK